MLATINVRKPQPNCALLISLLKPKIYIQCNLSLKCNLLDVSTAFYQNVDRFWDKCFTLNAV